MSNGMILFIVVALLTVVALIADEAISRTKFAERCERAGGVMLKYKPYRHSADYACIRKDAIVEL